MSLTGNVRILMRLAGGAMKSELFQPRVTTASNHFYAGPISHRHYVPLAFARTVTTVPLTKNLHLMTDNPNEGARVDKQSLQLVSGGSSARPLSIILSWLMSEKKHLMKYARFYLDQGFDVLVVRTSPAQFLLPTIGSQVVAGELLKFMTTNDSHRPMFIHGFSVGGYLWGEVLHMMNQDPAKYKSVVDKISGQIWDSVVDFHGTPKGVPKAIFPRSKILRKSMEMYIRGHMAALHNVATKHYLQSAECFVNTVIPAPALFLCSQDDPICNVSEIQSCADNWSSMGTKVSVKAWDSSPHVNHLHHHPEEYVQEMKLFLEKLGLVRFPEKFFPVAAAAHTA